MKKKLVNLLKWSQKYTKTDMVYIAKGGFWLIVAKVGLSAISFVTMIAFANWLPKESYGTYQFVVSGLGLLVIFSLPGINTSIIKSIAQKKEGNLPLALKTKMKWGVIGSSLSLGIAGWYFLQGNNLLAGAFILVALFVPFEQSFLIFQSFWNGRKRFDMRTKYSIISAGLAALLLIPAIYLTNNILIIITILLTSSTFLNWLFYYKTKKQTINNEEDPKAISFGKSLTLINALQTAATYLDRIIIWSFLGAVPVAIYSFAKQPIDKIRAALPIAPLALPKLGENRMNEGRKKGILSKFFKLFAVTVPAAAILALIAPFIYKLFFPEYIESVTYFQALSITVAISPFILLNTVLVAEMKKGALYAINTGAPFLKIILFLALIPHFGIWGIIAAILIAELLRGLLSLYFFLNLSQKE